MRLILSLFTSLALTLSTLQIIPKEERVDDRLIDLFIMAYDIMYKDTTDLPDDYIILDLESTEFIDTTYEDRQKAIEHFKKYNKKVLNASLFKLQQIGLADETGSLQIRGCLLTMTCIQPDEDGGVIIEGYKWVTPVGAYIYKLKFKVVDGKWKFIKIISHGIA